MPSPTKKSRTTDWIQDEDMVSPKKPSRRNTPIEDSQSPLFEPSPMAARPTDSYIDGMRSQFTQELINQISGDTEEDTDMDEVRVSASSERNSRSGSYESPLRQSFSVFRDSTFAGSIDGIGEEMDFDEQELPEFSERRETASLQADEDEFFNLPSSDNIAADSHSAHGNGSSFLHYERTSSLARELLESDDINIDEIGRNEYGREGPGKELERDEMVLQEHAGEGIEREEPAVEQVESVDFQRREDFQRESQSTNQQEIDTLDEEPLAKQSLEAANNIDPSLQAYKVPLNKIAPLSLPLIQTSGFSPEPIVSMAPPSVGPRSPKTPDLRPQPSAALPLPSPFPGDDLATSYMDEGASDWQPSQGFMLPLRRSLPGFGFGFGFQSDGLDRRYSTEADATDAGGVIVPQVELTADKFEQEVPKEQSVLPDHAMESPVAQENVQIPSSPPLETSMSEAISGPRIDPVILQAETEFNPKANQDVVHGDSITNVQMGYMHEQVASAQALADLGGAEWAHEDMAEFDELNDDSIRPPLIQYPDLPPLEHFSAQSSQSSSPKEERVPVAPTPLVVEMPSSDGAMLHKDIETQHAAYHDGQVEGQDRESELERHSDIDDSEDEALDSEEEDEDDYDENEYDDEDEGGVRVGPDHRSGPPLPNFTAPPVLLAAPEVIDLLWDSDEASSSEEESDLESVNGDQEEVRVIQIDSIDNEAEEDEDEEQEEDDEEPPSDEDREDEDQEDDDDDVMDSSDSEDDNDPDQGVSKRALEPSGSQYIPSFDGANDSPSPSNYAPLLTSDDRTSSSMPVPGGSHTLNAVPPNAVAMHDRLPVSSASLPQTRTAAVVIEIGSDSENEEEETESAPNTAPPSIIKRESAGAMIEVEDTYGPSDVDDESMEDYAPPKDPVDVSMDDQPPYLSEDTQVETTSRDQRLPDLSPEPPPSRRRPAVTFAPRVSRRRAAGDDQLTTQLEHQSSQPLASSQDTFRRPKLVIQDTFEGMIHSDGSVTTAPPSSRDQGSVETTDDENDTPIIQLRVSTNHPPHKLWDSNAQPMSSPPAMISDLSPDVPIPYSDLPVVPESGASEPQHFSRRPKSRPQQSVAESTLATPDASQFTQSQPSFSNHDDETAHPPTLHLTQDNSNLSQHDRQSQALQQSFDENLRINNNRSQKLERSLKRVRKETSKLYTSQVTQYTSDALLTRLGNIKNDKELTEAFVRESGKQSQKFREESSRSSKIDPWFSPRKPKHRHQSSSSLHSSEGEPLQENQALRDDRFNSEGVKIDENDESLSSHLDEVHGKVSQSPPVEHNTFKTQSLQDVFNDEADDYPSSQLPTQFTFSQTQPSQTKGLLTSLTYYTPLSNLMTRVSTQSSQSYNEGTDVIAVVTKASRRPLRAETGPKDFGTSFLLSDIELWPHKVLVTVYRPWKGALPVVEIGDIILLRGFDVLPKKGGSGLYLRSNEGSAWCVWNFSYKFDENELNSDDPPEWARKEKRGEVLMLEDREKVTGPYVQRGEEERNFVQDLRAFWVDKAETDSTMQKNGGGH